jgi:hypothetical protein
MENLLVKLMILPLRLRPWYRRTLHCSFNCRGSFNDINVFHRFHLFGRVASGDVLACKYNVNGYDYTMGYYLAGGIYPSCSRFFKSILTQKQRKRLNFQRHKKHAKRTLKELLVFYKLGLPLFGGLARFWGKRNLQQHPDMLCDSLQHGHRG